MRAIVKSLLLLVRQTHSNRVGSQRDTKVKEIVDSKGHRIWGKGEAKNPLSVSPYHVSLLAIFLCPQTGNKAAKL